jgi:Glutamine amidotransferases class-II
MKNTFGGFLRNSPPIIMGGVLMFRSARMHRTGARSSASGTSSHMQYWADYITATHESSFWKRQLDVRLFKEATAAADSDWVRFIANHDLRSLLVIAHTRRATRVRDPTRTPNHSFES